jgi:putative heme-binding domain-containing protein
LSDATDKAGGGHAHCGLMIYQGDNWPEKFRNKLYTANFHGRRINSETIHRHGNSYVAHHSTDHFSSDDPWFRGVELVSGPDGGVFLLDWSDIGECHENDGIHRTSGRIFKIVHGKKSTRTIGDLNKLSNKELIELQSHKDQWFVRKSRRLLQEQFAADTKNEANAETARQLLTALQSTVDADLKLRLLWTMYSCDLLDAKLLLETTKHPDEHVRSWAVRFLTDGRISITKAVVERLIELGWTDDSRLVRLYLASGLKRLDARQALELAAALASRTDDADDRTQPHLIWYGIEPHVVTHPELTIQMLIDCEVPLLQENISRRLFSEIDSQPQFAELLMMAGISIANAASRKNILLGAEKALTGWNHATAPQAWNDFQRTVRSDGFNQANADRMKRLNLVFGDQLTIDDLYRTINDRSASHQARCNAIESVGRLKPDERLFKTLKSSIRSRELTNSVIKAMAKLSNQQIPDLLLKQFKSMDAAGHQLAVDLLSTRLTFANKLLDAIEKGRIPKHMLTASHARRLANFDDTELNEKLTKTWGLVGSTSAEQESAIEKYRETFTDEKITAADIAIGKTLFETHCASCHVMRGQGGRIGPDLTGSDRKNLHYLLENILAPSSSVADSYRASLVSMEDGRLLEGIIVSKNNRTLKLQTKDALLSIDLSDVAATKTTKRSLMPEDLLKPLSEHETASLFKYLQN